MRRQPTHQPSRKSLGGAFGILELMPPIRRRTYRVKVRLMEIADYERIYALWMSTPGMGLNSTDDSRKGVAKRLVNHVMKALEEEGINKTALVVFERNELGNRFWENMGFSVRDDLVYRNKNIHELKRINP